MVQLKQLHIQNFKGFGEKTVMEFYPGIGALVGPNGCGKSNIVDAIKWGLGEQKLSELRGERMDEMIFNGAQGRSAHHYAEVELVFDNHNKLFKEYPQEEVRLLRRLYRSGEMEYAINGENCRLKDIQGLLFDTGLGRLSYAIIAQGNINKLLLSSHHDKLRLLEEAAGITQYRERQREYQRKLLKTETELKRVDAIFHELFRRRHALQKQSSASREYFKLKQQLRTLELLVAVRKLTELETQSTKLKQQRTKLETRQQTISTKVKAAREQKELALEKQNQTLHALEQQELKLKNKLALLHMEEKTVNNHCIERDAEQREHGSQLKTVTQMLHKLTAQHQAQRQTAVKINTELRQLGQRDQTLEKKLRMTEANRKARQAAMADIEQQLVASELARERIREQLDAIPDELYRKLEALLPSKVLRGEQQGKREAEHALFAKRLSNLLQLLPARVATMFTDLLKAGANTAAGKRVMTELKDFIRHELAELSDAYVALSRQDAVLIDIAGVWEKIYVRKQKLAGQLSAETQRYVKLQRNRTAEQKAFHALSAECETLRGQTVQAAAQLHECKLRQKQGEVEMAALLRSLQDGQERKERLDKLSAATAQKQSELAKHKQLLRTQERELNGQIQKLVGQLTAERRRLATSSQTLQRLNVNVGDLEQQLTKLAIQLQGINNEHVTLNTKRENLIATTAEYLEEELLKYRESLVKRRLVMSPSIQQMIAQSPAVQQQTPLNLKTLTLGELEKLLALLKGRVQNFSTINPLAEQELKDLDKEYGLVAKERLDVKAALKNLAVLEKQISSESKRIFHKAFKQIAKNFSEIIKTIFPGGTGTLSMQAHRDAERSEVQISVQPAGKLPRKLDLFSGGEKSLILIALIFAIFMIKPAPICILDEVDAALDDDNLARFLELVKRFQTKTQLLLISHNRKTFSIFDYLYGISMREGVSRLFSLKLPKQALDLKQAEQLVS